MNHGFAISLAFAAGIAFNEFITRPRLIAILVSVACLVVGALV